ncbi:MAG TPA: hypothetical protein VGG86_11425 [Roseiarcus sp.]|jgi:hypothetical protein
MAMILKFVTKNGTKVYGPPYTKQEEADFYRHNANGPVTIARGANIRKTRKSRAPQIRRRQSQRAPGIREQSRPKADNDRSGFLQRKFILKPISLVVNP